MFEEAEKLDEAFDGGGTVSEETWEKLKAVPKRLPFRISPNEELSEQQWERIQNIIRKHKGEG